VTQNNLISFLMDLNRLLQVALRPYEIAADGQFAVAEPFALQLQTIALNTHQNIELLGFKDNKPCRCRLSAVIVHNT
jgi:hypothetical protein